MTAEQKQEFDKKKRRKFRVPNNCLKMSDARLQLIAPVNRAPIPDNVAGVLVQLEKRERVVMMLRLGIGGHRVHTTQEVADLFGVDAGRIAKVERLIERKLRNL